MSEQALDTAFELLITEGYAGEIECECAHNHTSCSIEVTHIVTGCQGSARFCLNGATAKQSRMDNKTSRCAGCGQPGETCWSIRPI